MGVEWLRKRTQHALTFRLVRGDRFNLYYMYILLYPAQSVKIYLQKAENLEVEKWQGTTEWHSE